MKKRNREERVECIAYISVIGDLRSIEKREQKQEQYLREYAKAHNICIAGVVHRKGLGQAEVNKQFDQILELIRKRKAEGILVLNMRAVSADLEDAYHKVGKMAAAGGVMITVDEGRLSLKIHGDYVKKQ